MMKKILLTIGFVGMVCSTLVAQTYTVKFTGCDQNGRRIPLSKVLVENQTQSWREVLHYPDTVIFMGVVGIEDYDRNDSVQLLQNVPNPFAGTTDFSLQLNRDEKVHLEIYDLCGKLIAQHSRQLVAGHHLFRATLASPQTYLLSAKTCNGLMQIKMVNTGSGGSNAIEYLGEGVTGELQCVLHDGKGASHYPFSYGDWMLYTGYAEVVNVPFISTPVNKSQTQSETIPLTFTLPLPAVFTVSPTGVTAQSANLEGEVAADSGYAITERGFDYGTSQNALDQHIVVGTGAGEFNAIVDSLQPGTQYYFRAFAVNAMGPNYGTVMNFTTLATVPTVVTNGVTNIAATTATGNGDVTANGGATVTARGVCWSTSLNPTIADSHTSDGTGTGSFTSSITGLAAATTYYVRAYATNSAGTGYGSMLSFVTSIGVDTTLLTDDNSCAVTNAMDNEIVVRNRIVAVKDHQNNLYTVVQKEGHCWLNENMRCTTSPSTGTDIVENPAVLLSYTGKKAYYYNNALDSALNGYGLLYNWNAAVDTFNVAYGELLNNTYSYQSVVVEFTGFRRGICPEGWHIPAYDERVSFTNKYGGGYCGSFSENRLPGEWWYWTSNQLNNEGGRCYALYCCSSYTYKACAMAVRCLRDTDSVAVNSDCQTYLIEESDTITSAQLPYVWHGRTLLAQGVYYDSLQTAQECDSVYILTLSVMGAIADGLPCSNTPTVTDYDGNVYNTIVIGSQCWTKENMKTTHLFYKKLIFGVPIPIMG